jgi:hypothetical protein
VKSTPKEDARPKPDAALDRAGEQGLQPWQFFVLAALGCATAVTFMSRGEGLVAVILLGVMMASAAAVGLAGVRMLRPLVAGEEDRTVMIGQRTRAALDREKHLTLRAIKELEFDRAMGKLADADFAEMSNRLRARAAGLMRQLDAGSGYRDQIERDLTTRLKGDAPARSPRPDRPIAAARVCADCATPNDQDAKFCKGCGRALADARS